MLRTLLFLLILTFASLAQAADRGLPLMEETVDEIIYMQTIGCDHLRIIFIKDGSVLATRLMVDDMMLVTEADGFYLMWQDYWTAERVVRAKKVSHLIRKDDPSQVGQDGLWWCMFRNMRDLKQP